MGNVTRYAPLGLLGLVMMAAGVNAATPAAAPKSLEKPEAFGRIERKDPRLDKLIPPGAEIEKLAAGFDWSEGPVWVRGGKGGAEGFLLFSDVPMNVVYKWEPGKDVSVFLKPSGYAGTTPRGGEPGSNGLTLDSEGRLVLCQHGDRRVARVEKDGKQTPLADRFEGKRFNSPNDLVFDSKGNLYFTDPPYGLEGGEKSPLKELDFQGVYRVSPDGKVTLVTKELSRPNGLALSPDEKTLYVANSDPGKALWMAFDLKDDGTAANGRVFFDATALAKAGAKGLPDGLKVDVEGNVFATGPGGVFVLAPDGTHLGTIVTGEANGNCAWGEDGSMLYINSDMYLARVKTTTKGRLPGPKAGE